MVTINVKQEFFPEELAKCINANLLEDRIQVFRDINLGYESIEQLKKVFKKISEDLVDADLTKNEMFILLTTFESLQNKIKKRVKELIKKEK